MSDRETRIGQNESWFRKVNESLESLLLEQRDADLGAWFRIVCECADEECAERIAISVTEYERVRANPRRFVVAAGHADGSVERVVAEHGPYEIVEKRGDAGLVAQMEAPRTEN